MALEVHGFFSDEAGRGVVVGDSGRVAMCLRINTQISGRIGQQAQISEAFGLLLLVSCLSDLSGWRYRWSLCVFSCISKTRISNLLCFVYATYPERFACENTQF